MNEVQIMEKLDHINIIKIYHYKKVYNKFIIYMEYADDGISFPVFLGDLFKKIEELKLKNRRLEDQ